MAALSIMTSYIYYAHSVVSLALVYLKENQITLQQSNENNSNHDHCLSSFGGPGTRTNAPRRLTYLFYPHSHSQTFIPISEIGN